MFAAAQRYKASPNPATSAAANTGAM